MQRKYINVVANSQGLVDYATGLVNPLVNLHNRQVGKFKLQRNCIKSVLIKNLFGGLVEMTQAVL